MNGKDRAWWKKFHKGLAEQSRFIKCSPAPEVDKPTYEVVGEIERVDQRDTIQARTMLKDPNSFEYKDYYDRHPEFKESDDKNRATLKKSLQKHFSMDPLGAYFQPNVFATRHILGLPELIEPGKEGTPLWQMFETDNSAIEPEERTERIKSLARFFGITKARVTHLRKEWVYTNYAHPYTPYPYGKPIDDMDYEYVICLAMRQNLTSVRAGNNYLYCIDAGWRYSLTSLVSITLANLIRSWGFRARPLTPENSPYMVVPTFIDAGMGEQGRMGICVTKEFGNNFRPGGVTTDMPLVIDKPVDFGLQDFCDKCKICADACPSGAIPKDRKMVRRGVYRWQAYDQKCRAYWDRLGHPCSICQAVCPFSFESTLLHDTVREVTQRIKPARRAALWGHKIFYGNQKWYPDPEWAYKPRGSKETDSLPSGASAAEENSSD